MAKRHTGRPWGGIYRPLVLCIVALAGIGAGVLLWRVPVDFDGSVGLAGPLPLAPLWVFLFGVLLTALIGAGLAALRSRAARANEIDRAHRALQAEVERRRQAECQMAETEQRLRLALGAVADGVWDWNIATGEVFFSDSWLASLGYGRAEVEPTVEFWERLLHPDDRQRTLEAVARHFAGETRTYECENRLRARSGEYRWNLDRGRVVSRDADGRPLRMVGADLDITERKAREEEQRRLAQQLQHAQKLESLGVLAGGIAHDFNNLLVGILGGADLALEGVPAGSPVAEQLGRMRRAAERAAELTRQMLAYSGQGSLPPAPLDLADEVREISDLLRSSISKKALLQLELNERCTVQGDSTQIRQIIMNLLTNASEALAGRNGTIGVRTCVVDADRDLLASMLLGEELAPGPYALIEVTDTGDGMDEQTQGRMFDPFFTTKSQGRGLGLAAVLGIVRRHGGALRVSSAPGRGTSVRLLLPHAAGAATPARHEVLPRAAGEDAPAADAPEPASRDGRRTVLVVDDDEVVRSVASEMLRSAGFQVLVAEDGRAGVDAFREHADSIDVVLLDMTMPHLSGDEVLREIREVRRDARVLLSSGYHAEQAWGSLAEQGFAGFVQKPYSLEVLLAKLEQALGG